MPGDHSVLLEPCHSFLLSMGFFAQHPPPLLMLTPPRYRYSKSVFLMLGQISRGCGSISFRKVFDWIDNI